MSSVPPYPQPLIEIRVDRLELEPPLAAGCAGFELGKWRAPQLAKHLLQWLPEFALRWSEWKDVSAENAVVKVGQAAKLIYETDNFERRGECGEILLHIFLRQHFGSIPAISKIFFKDSRNDTVKGFDAVHVVPGDDWELWLGEVKFYTDVKSAIRDAIKELADHLTPEYLRGEFAAIVNKLDDDSPEVDWLLEKLSNNRSLDEIFTAICVPVLLAYDSDAVKQHTIVSDEYLAEFEAEVLSVRGEFQDRLPDLPVRVHLLLFPMADKAVLVEEWDRCLKSCQELV